MTECHLHRRIAYGTQRFGNFGLPVALLDAIVQASRNKRYILMYEMDAALVSLAMQAQVTQLASESGQRRTWLAIEQQLDQHLLGTSI